MKTPKQNSLQQLGMESDKGLDPLMVHQFLFEKRISLPTMLSMEQKPEVYPMSLRVMKHKDEEKLLIFLMSEADLYFVYKIEVGEEEIHELNEKHSLKIENLSEFAEMIFQLVGEIEKGEKSAHLECLEKEEMTFKVTCDYKGKKYAVLELLASREEEEKTKIIVAYRYGSLRETVKQKEERIMHFREFIRLKNPYLLKYFNKQ